MPRLNNTPLTQRVLDATPVPATGRIELRDPSVRGLVVRIMASGAKSFSIEYRSPITKKMTRDTLSATTLSEARSQAIKRKMAIHDGRDPAREAREALQVRQIEYAQKKSVAYALDAYEEDFVSGLKAASRRQRILKLRRAVEPFSDRLVASLSKGELVSRLDVIQAESGPVARNRAHLEIRAWQGWLHERDHVPTIVLAGVKKRIAEQTRTRVLTDAELAAMLTATADGSAFSDVVRVLVHTGMRKGEAASLQPRDLDFVARTIKVRAEVSKTKRERVIPMVDAIVPLLKARASLRSTEYIFGEGSAFRSQFSGWGQVDRVRAAMPEGDVWTLHDIRRTVATRLYDAGVDSLVIEDLLGHISTRQGVAGIYNRSVTLTRQREALEAWAARLALLAGGNVVPLRRTA